MFTRSLQRRWLESKDNYTKFREYGFVIEGSFTWTKPKFASKIKTGKTPSSTFSQSQLAARSILFSPPGLWSQSPSNYGRLEPGPKIIDGGAGAHAIMDSCSRGQRIIDCGAGAQAIMDGWNRGQKL